MEILQVTKGQPIVGKQVETDKGLNLNLNDSTELTASKHTLMCPLIEYSSCCVYGGEQGTESVHVTGHESTSSSLLCLNTEFAK